MRSSIRILMLVAALLVASAKRTTAQAPSIAYTIRIDPATPDRIDVTMRIAHAPPALRLAMKVHPEYDAGYWRTIDSLHVVSAASNTEARVTRADSALWTATLPVGRGVVRYTVHVQPKIGAERRAWQTTVRRDGALINPPDVLLYLPDLASSPVDVSIDAPREWRIATALRRTASATHFTARDAATLLDSPIMLGALREWTFSDRGVRFHLDYWPLPDAVPFDTLAFVDGVRRLTRVALDVFGRAPTRDFHFLVQDGAHDALEHRSSVTFGLPSRSLASNPHASIEELAHELFHTWNLVAIHPDQYGALSYRRPVPTTGLWFGEGVTLYYANLLVRRAGLAPASPSRLEHLRRLVERYYASPAVRRVSPERASAAFGASPFQNADATGGYYLQGELLGFELDAIVHDSTRDRRGLDDVMRALYAGSANGAGYSSASLERTTESVCGCRLEGFFAAKVRGTTPIDAGNTLGRLGLRMVVDTIVARDSAGAPLPDRRLAATASATDGRMRILARDSSTAWARAGLRTADVLESVNGAAVTDFASLQRALLPLRVGDTAEVAVRRDDRPMRIRVPVGEYASPRVRFLDAESVSAAQRERRARFLSGW